MKKGYLSKGLRIIFSYLAKYKKDLVVLSILGVISAIANGTVPYLVGRFFDAIIEPSKVFVNTKAEMPLWLFFILIWVIVQLVANVVDWVSNTKRELVGHKIYTNYIVKSFAFFLNLPLAFHKNRKMGELADKIDRSAGQLHTISDSVIINLTPQFLSIFVALVIAFWINLSLAFVLVVGVLIYVIILFKLISPTADLQKKMHENYSKAYGSAYDSIFPDFCH